MLLSSVIIVLREVLEAALIVSVLLAVSHLLPARRHWPRWAFGLGIAGAVAYAVSIATVSEWFDGVGQEVVNAALQIAIYLLLMWLNVLFVARRTRGGNNMAASAGMIAAVTLAVSREGSEILLYLSGFAGSGDMLTPVLIGGAIGAGIGASTGALIYYSLLRLRAAWATPVLATLLALVAAGMLSQAALQLIQADWLPSQYPLWDSSAWLPENSVTGQLLYALLGYEATPTPIQVAFHIGGLTPLALLPFIARRGPAPASSGHTY